MLKPIKFDAMKNKNDRPVKGNEHKSKMKKKTHE